MTTLFLEHANGRIAYDEAGAGPLVVCVPSMGDVRGEYRFLAPRLTEDDGCTRARRIQHGMG